MSILKSDFQVIVGYSVMNHMTDTATSKVTSFFWKVLTAIFVNLGQCPCKLVKMENDRTSSKINIFQQNFNRKCILTLPIDLYKQKLKIWKNSRFFPISRFFPKKWHFWRFWNKIPDRNKLFGTYLIWCYKVAPFSFPFSKLLKALSIFLSIYDRFSFTYDFHKYCTIFA